MLVLLLSCGNPLELEDRISNYEVPKIHVESLTPLQQQRRFFLDLLGIFPTQNDIELILDENLENNSSTNENWLTEDWVQVQLKKSEHRERLVHLFTEWLLTRVDAFNVTHRSYGIPQSQSFLFRRSIGEEPTRLMSYIGSQDMDFREIVMADYTLSNDILLDIWPLERLESQDSQDDNQNWFRAKYTDGRPAGGVLMTNGLWWRYYTTPHNYSRTRAMALTDLFLCENYLLKPIKFSAPSLLERDALNEVIQSDEACIGCHSTLDPIASAIFGFWWFDLYDVTEMTSYHPERENLGSYYMNQEPAYFGVPLQSPSELGYHIANDHRFYTCTTKNMMSLLLRRDIELSDFNQIITHKDAFIKGDFRLSRLISSIIQSEEYVAGSFDKMATEEEIQKIQTKRILTASQWKTALYDLTGFEWQVDHVDLLEDDINGYRTLLGGIDSYNVTKVLTTTNLSRQITVKRISQAAAHFVVSQDLSRHVEDRKLLFLQDQNGERSELWEDSNDVRFNSEEGREWLHQFSLRIYGEPLLENIEEEYIAFYTEIEAAHGQQAALESTIAVLLRDPAFWTY